MSIAPGYIENNWNTLISSAVVLCLGSHEADPDFTIDTMSGYRFTLARELYLAYLCEQYPAFKPLKEHMDNYYQKESKTKDIFSEMMDEFLEAHEIYDSNNYVNNINVVALLLGLFAFNVRMDKEMYEELYDGPYAEELFGCVNAQSHIEYKQLQLVVWALMLYNYKGFEMEVRSKYNENVEEFDRRRQEYLHPANPVQQQAQPQQTYSAPQQEKTPEQKYIDYCCDYVDKINERMKNVTGNYNEDSNVRYISQASVAQEYLKCFRHLINIWPDISDNVALMAYFVDYWSAYCPQYANVGSLVSPDEFLDIQKRLWKACKKKNVSADVIEGSCRKALSNAISNSLLEFAQILQQGRNITMDQCNWSIIHDRLEYLIGECFPDIGVKIARENAMKN